MSNRHTTDTLRSIPLRRLDRYALLTYLGRRARPARLRWSKLNLDGRLRAWPRTGALSFSLMQEVTMGLGLPEEACPVSLVFKIRGLLFRCEGLVRKLDSANGRLLLKPDSVEWSARGLEVRGARLPRKRAHLEVQLPGSRSQRYGVPKVADGTLSMICWPRPKKLENGLQIEGRLDLPGSKRLPLRLRIAGARPVFPGSQGRIVQAEIERSPEALHGALDALYAGPTMTARVA